MSTSTERIDRPDFETMERVSDQHGESIADVSRRMVAAECEDLGGTPAVLTFGRHKGQHVQDLPTEYLSYLLGAGRRHLPECMAQRVADEFAERMYDQHPEGAYFISGQLQAYHEGDGYQQPQRAYLTFGAHKGSELGDVPDDYLGWLAGQEFVHVCLRRDVLEVLAQRLKGMRPQTMPQGEASWRWDPSIDPLEEPDEARADQVCLRLLGEIDFDEEARP